MVRIPQPTPTSSCCCGCSLRSSVFIFAVLDCISGTLGFVGSIITLISKADISFTAVRTNVPVQHILELFLFTLIIASGAVGIQAFNTLHVPTARTLFLLKFTTFLFVTIMLFVDIIARAAAGHKVSSYVIFVILWNVAIPGYVVYIIWSFYKHLEENILEDTLPFGTRSRASRHFLEAARLRALPGMPSQQQPGHCAECFLIPGSNSQCGTCTHFNTLQISNELPPVPAIPPTEIVTGHPLVQQSWEAGRPSLQLEMTVPTLQVADDSRVHPHPVEPESGGMVAGNPVYFTVQFPGDVLRVVDAQAPSSPSVTSSSSSSDEEV